MKFYIDKKEIKTVIKNASIEGSLNQVSRIASFSYVSLKNSDFNQYGAKIGSSVLIVDEKNQDIFKGKIISISYDSSKSLVSVRAKDLTSILLETKIKGRFKGNLVSIIKKSIGSLNITLVLMSFLSKKLNILNLGKLSLYDIISIAVSKVYGKEFKFYIDSSSKINILIPALAESKGDFATGINVINAVYVSTNDANRAKLTAVGDSKIVAGVMIHLSDSISGADGYFIVEKDRHVFAGTHTMELELKERKLF